MRETAIRLVGSAILVLTVGLLGAVGYELTVFVFGANPLAMVSATVPLSQTELGSLVALFVGLLALGVLFWVYGRSSHNSQYNGEE